MGIFENILKTFHKDNTSSEQFGGVPIASLNAIANKCADSGYVSVSGKALYFHYKPEMNKQAIHTTYIIEDGKLKISRSETYPGQIRFPEEDFCEQVNEKYTFTN